MNTRDSGMQVKLPHEWLRVFRVQREANPRETCFTTTLITRDAARFILASLGRMHNPRFVLTNDEKIRILIGREKQFPSRYSS